MDNLIDENENLKEAQKLKLSEPENHKAKNKLIEVFFRVAISKYFNHFINFSIVLNTIVLAMDRHPIGKTEQTVLENINI